MATVEKVFHFLATPADVLSSATACRRWRALASADSVWRARFEREKLVEKARAFEVALPAVPAGHAAAAAEQDETAGVGLAFYARVFVLEGYPMRNEGRHFSENPDHDGGIRTAVHAWCEDPAAAKAKYGPIASWDTSDVTDLSWLFEDKYHFNEDISRWNVSNVTYMDGLFCRATSFNGDLSSWDVGQVQAMETMFDGAASFNGDLSSWDVGQVQAMYWMFHDAASFNGDLSRWDVGQVRATYWMFAGATSFNGDLSRWEVGQVRNMDYMFSGATSCNHQLGGAWATSTATKNSMFHSSPGSIVGKAKGADGTIA